jgi:hypothetical protein
MIEIGFSFATGILLTLAGVWLTSYYQRKHEKTKDKEKIRFEVYMNLLDISASYFWVTSAESRGEKPNSESLHTLRQLTFKTSDKLRQMDEIEHLEEILDVLFNQKYETALERSEKLDQLIDKMDKIVSPRFMKKMKEITKDNQHALMTRSLQSLNAPATSKF